MNVVYSAQENGGNAMKRGDAELSPKSTTASTPTHTIDESIENGASPQKERRNKKNDSVSNYSYEAQMGRAQFSYNFQTDRRGKCEKCAGYFFLPIRLVLGILSLFLYVIGYYLAVIQRKIWSCFGYKDCAMHEFAVFRYLAMEAWFKLQFISVKHSYSEAGLKEEFEGSNSCLYSNVKLNKAAFLIGNHVSYMDGPTVISKCGQPKVITMSGVKKLPVLGGVAKSIECIFVDRANTTSRSSTLDAIRHHAANWKMGDKPLMVFSEGRTSNGDQLLDFKKGAFVGGVPVQPILLKYTGNLTPSATYFMAGDKPGERIEDFASYAGRSSGSLDSESKEQPLLENEPVTENCNRVRYKLPKDYSFKRWVLNFYMMLGINVEIRIMPIYVPNEEEKNDAELFAKNVQTKMSAEYAKMKNESR